MNLDLDWQLAMSDLLSAARPTHYEMERLCERVGADPPRPALKLPEVIDEFVRLVSRDREILSRIFQQIPRVLPHIDARVLDRLRIQAGVDEAAAPIGPMSQAEIVATLGETVNQPASRDRGSFNITQFIGSLQGVAFQEVQGDVISGLQVSELKGLIDKFGGRDRAELDSAVSEIEQSSVSEASRRNAVGVLRGFLARLGDRVESSAIAILQAYVEGKLNLPSG